MGYDPTIGGPVRVAPFATFGSAELAETAVEALADRRGALLANHGALTYGDDLDAAVARAEVLEWLCDVWLRAAAAGTPRVLDPDRLGAVAGELARRGYGRTRPADDGQT